MRVIWLFIFLTAMGFAQQVNLDLDLPVNPNHPIEQPAPKDLGLRSWGGNTQSTPTASTDIEVPPIPPPAPPPEKPIELPTPPIFFGEEIPAETDSVYYVIDISGSMSWDTYSLIDLEGNKIQGNRLDKAKIELSRSILGLAPNFKFNIVAYECILFPWSAFSVQANDPNKQNALAWVKMLTPRGATATGPATSFALNDRSNQSVVLLTDGAPNCGAMAWLTYITTGYYNEPAIFGEHRAMIRANNLQGARITVFGISASGAMREFCQAVAADSGGSYHDVP